MKRYIKMKLIGTYSKRAPTGGGYLIVTNVDAHLKRPLDPPPNQPNPRLAQQTTASPFHTVRLSPEETEVLSYLVTIYNQRSTLTKSTPGFLPRASCSYRLPPVTKGKKSWSYTATVQREGHLSVRGTISKHTHTSVTKLHPASRLPHSQAE